MRTIQDIPSRLRLNRAAFSSRFYRTTVLTLLFLTLSFVSALDSSAQALPTEANYDSEPSEERLARAIDSRVAERLNELRIPGYAISVVQDGRVILQRGYGVANVAGTAPAIPPTVFGLASITKIFTAFVLLSLVDEGKISLNEPIGTYMKGLSPAWSRLTPRQLASMTAGIRKGIKREFPWPQEMNKMMELPLVSQPGTQFLYSNASYRTLGTLIETVTGKSYAENVRERILMPLAMMNTGPVQEMVRRGVISQPFGDNQGQTTVHPINYKKDSVTFAAGMLASNVIDLQTYAQALMNEEGLSKLAYRVLLSERPNLPNGTPAPWAFGWSSQNAEQMGGRRVITMNGANPGSSSTILIVPEARLTIVGLSNMWNKPVHQIPHMVARMILQNPVEPVPVGNNN